MIGYPVSKVVIDAALGGYSVALRNSLADIKRFKAFLDQAVNTDQSLINLGYTQAEVTLIRANFTVLDQFRQCFEGTLAIPSPVNISSFITPFISTS